MIACQLSIFAENRPGRLAAVTRILAKEKINIRATTIATSDTFGVINLIVDDPVRAEAALAKSGMTVTKSPVLAVVIPDQPGRLDRYSHGQHYPYDYNEHYRCQQTCGLYRQTRRETRYGRILRLLADIR